MLIDLEWQPHEHPAYTLERDGEDTIVHIDFEGERHSLLLARRVEPGLAAGHPTRKALTVLAEGGATEYQHVHHHVTTTRRSSGINSDIDEFTGTIGGASDIAAVATLELGRAQVGITDALDHVEFFIVKRSAQIDVTTNPIDEKPQRGLGIVPKG